MWIFFVMTFDFLSSYITNFGPIRQLAIEDLDIFCQDIFG